MIRQILTISLLMMLFLPPMTGCATPSGPTLQTERFLACPIETVWAGAQEALSPYSITVKDKHKGIIETEWLEQAVEGRPYGLFGREGLGDKERSRVTVQISPLPANVVKIQLTERRQHWGFRGGARIYDWYPVEPSQDAVNQILNQFTARLEKEGCLVES